MSMIYVFDFGSGILAYHDASDVGSSFGLADRSTSSWGLHASQLKLIWCSEQSEARGVNSFCAPLRKSDGACLHFEA